MTVTLHAPVTTSPEATTTDVRELTRQALSLADPTAETRNPTAALKMLSRVDELACNPVAAAELMCAKSTILLWSGRPDVALGGFEKTLELARRAGMANLAELHNSLRPLIEGARQAIRRQQASSQPV